MHIKVQFYRATVKELRMAWREAVRRGARRLILRVTPLLELAEGVSVAEAAERVGVAESTVYAWLHAFMERRCESLRDGRSPGRPSKLTPTQRDRLKELVAAGHPTGCGSSVLIADLIRREFGQIYNAHYLCTLLHNLGLSFQKARFLSDHLDEERRRVWIEEEWPAILPQARARGALLLFGDEASVAQWGSLSYTGAPIGQQPFIQTCGKRKAYKVFGLIDYFSGRLFAHGQTDRFTAATYCAFLTTVLDQTDQPLIMIQDGALPHCRHAGRSRQVLVVGHSVALDRRCRLVSGEDGQTTWRR